MTPDELDVADSQARRSRQSGAREESTPQPTDARDPGDASDTADTPTQANTTDTSTSTDTTAATDPTDPVDQTDSADAADSADPVDASVDQLRRELNEQFESIRIVSPGQYELNLMELYDREEYIISLREDGRYVIEVPDSWSGD